MGKSLKTFTPPCCFAGFWQSDAEQLEPVLDEEGEKVNGDVVGPADQDEHPALPEALHGPGHSALDAGAFTWRESVLALDLESNTLPGSTLARLSQQSKWVSHVGRLVEENHTQVGRRGQAAHHQVSRRSPQEVPLAPRVHLPRILQQQHVPGGAHTGHPEKGSAEVARDGSGALEVRMGKHNLEYRNKSQQLAGSEKRTCEAVRPWQ